MRPVDAPVGALEGLAAALEEGPQLAVHLEPVRHAQELLVQRVERVLGHGRARLAAHRPVELVLARVGRTAHRALQLGVGLADLGVGLVRHRRRLVRRDHALARQGLGVQLAHRRVLLDPLVHLGLGVGGLVGLVVTEAAVADQVDQGVAAERLAEGVREPHRRDAGLHVVGVHVDDRDVEALGEVRRIAGGAALVGIGGEAELVVGDHVHRAARGVAAQRLEVQRLGHDALAGEGGVAVDQDGQHRVRVVHQLARLATRLVGPRAALDHRVDELEMARVRRQRDRHAAPALRPVGARGAVVVLHVAGAALGRGGVGGQGLLALELHQDRLVGAPHRVGQHVQPSAVGHAENHLARAALGGELDQLVEHRHERVESLDRELLLAQERLVEVRLERLDLGQAPQQHALLLGLEGLAVGAGLDRLAQPDALLVIGDVLDLVRDRPGVRPAQAGQRVGEGLARAGHAQHRGRDAPHQVLGEVDRGRVERRIADRLGAERVEARGQVAVHAVGLDDARGRLHGLQERLVRDSAVPPGWPRPGTGSAAVTGAAPASPRTTPSTPSAPSTSS